MRDWIKERVSVMVDKRLNMLHCANEKELYEKVSKDEGFSCSAATYKVQLTVG